MDLQKIIERNYFLPWVVNAFLIIFYLFGANSSPLYTSVMYANVSSDAFNGTTLPIENVPDYTDMWWGDRATHFTDIPAKAFQEIPKYEPKIFGKNLDSIKVGTDEYKKTAQIKQIYTTPYMGNYKLDYREYAGSHLAVDVKAPRGTPVKSIANGVIVKAKDEPAGFGKNVVIRHDDVLINGNKTTIFSGYAHLDNIYAKPGTKVSKGTIIGEVGSTGATSTGDHLHFQIDTKDAPYKMYWPFTFSEAQQKGYNFYTAINAGLGKENALKYTIHPYNFVYDNLVNRNNTLVKQDEPKVELTSAPEKEETETPKEEKPKVEVATAVIEEEKEEEKTPEKEEKKYESIIKSEEKVALIDVESVDGLVSKETKKIETDNRLELASASSFLDLNLNNNLNEELLAVSDEKEEIVENEEEKEVVIKEVEEEKEEPKKEEQTANVIKSKTEYAFEDVSENHEYYEAIKFIKDSGIVKGYNDGTFKPEAKISRGEVVKILSTSFEIGYSEDTFNHFADLTDANWEKKYVNKFVEEGIIDAKNSTFNPNKAVSRIEGLKLTIKSSKKDIESFSGKKVSVLDVGKNEWFYKYVSYSIYNGLLSIQNQKFEPNSELTRGEFVNMIYILLKKDS